MGINQRELVAISSYGGARAASRARAAKAPAGAIAAASTIAAAATIAAAGCSDGNLGPDFSDDGALGPPRALGSPQALGPGTTQIPDRGHPAAPLKALRFLFCCVH